MEITTTIYDIVTFFPQAIDVLDRYNLDYYCNGSKPFIQACEEINVDTRQVWADIQKTTYVEKSINRSMEEWNAELLTDLILRHYSDLRGKLPELRQVVENMFSQSKKHTHTKIKNVYTCFNELADAVALHANSEEITLLKQIESMAKSKALKIHLTELDHEHRYIGSLISSLRHLTINYTPNENLSLSGSLAWIMLQQFDKDLTQRLHLENNILFPKLQEIHRLKHG